MNQIRISHIRIQSLLNCYVHIFSNFQNSKMSFSLTNHLSELKLALEKSLITNEEYTTMRAKLLESFTSSNINEMKGNEQIA